MRGHVRKRGNTYSIIYDERPDPTSGERNQREVGGFRTREDADTALAEAIAAVKRGGYVRPDRVTVRQYLEDWVARKADDDLKATTARGYRSKIRTYLVPRLGSMRVQDLDVLAIEETLRGIHRNGGRGERPVSVSTVKASRQVLGAALDDAVRLGLLATNPARLARVPSKERPDYEPRNKPQQPWSTDELRTFLAGSAEDRLYALWATYSATGARRGELLALRWPDVDLDAGTIHIHANRVPGEDDDGHRVVLDLDTPKTSKSNRTLKVDPDTVRVLREHRARQVEEKMANRLVWQDEDRVFANEDGTGLDPDRVSRWFEELVEELGVRRVRLHDLRHGHATTLLALGVPIEVVSRRLGHARISITYDLYVHPDEDQQATAADVWGRMLGDEDAG